MSSYFSWDHCFSDRWMGNSSLTIRVVVKAMLHMPVSVITPSHCSTNSGDKFAYERRRTNHNNKKSVCVCCSNHQDARPNFIVVCVLILIDTC